MVWVGGFEKSVVRTGFTSSTFKRIPGFWKYQTEKPLLLAFYFGICVWMHLNNCWGRVYPTNIVVF